VGPAAEAYGWGVQNINAMQVHLGRWVRTHTPPDAVLAVNDLGALSYFGERRVLDLMGLATPAILPYRRQGPAGIARFVETRCPDYLVIFPDWFPELAARADWLRPLERVRLAHNLVAGAAEMVLYETAWSRGAATLRPCSP
jgi:arabinofuranosyltransferase